MSSPKSFRRFEAYVLRQKKKSDQLATLRLIAFLCLASSWLISIWLTVGLAIGFIFLVRVHAQAKRTLKLLRSRIEVGRRFLAVRELTWKKLPAWSDPRLPSSEPYPEYFTDLDVVGSQSLLRLLDWTSSTAGAQALSHLFMSNGISDEAIQHRTQAVSELRHLPVLRWAYFSRAHPITEKGEIHEQTDTLKILSLLKQKLTSTESYRTLLSVLYTLQVISLSLWGYFFFRGGRPYFLIPAALLLILNFAGRKVIWTGEAYGWALSLAGALGRFRTSVALLEKYSSTSRPALRTILSPFHSEHSATGQLRHLERITGALAIRQNPVVHVLLHLILPWDFFWAVRLARLQHTLRVYLPQWEAALGEFEALLSIANYAEANPEYQVAEQLHDPKHTLQAEGLRHPLIAKTLAIANPVQLDQQERCILITGSNMSGKSTFLRSVGLNLLLAKAGSPVPATVFRFRNLPIYSSLRGSDSLSEGLSSFYAEVRRLKGILVEAESRPIFFLIDEIFRGTNNRERLIGSRAYIRQITQLQSFGLVTTHDLELANLEEEKVGIVNYHFRESITGHEMSFSYRKERGPCPTTNALQVMKLSGLPIE